MSGEDDDVPHSAEEEEDEPVAEAPPEAAEKEAKTGGWGDASAPNVDKDLECVCFVVFGNLGLGACALNSRTRLTPMRLLWQGCAPAGRGLQI
jgi:hypothetical protein